MFRYRIFYQLKTTRQNVRAHAGSFFLSLAAVSFTLLLFASYMLLLSNFQSMKKRLGEHLQMTLYLKKNLSDKDRRDLVGTVSAMEEVADVRYCSPDEALGSLRSSLGQSARVLDGLKGNPLPGSLEVQLDKEHRNLRSMQGLAHDFQALKGVDEVEYGGEWIKRFFAFVRILRWLGIAVGFLLLVATVIVISSTLTLSFYARKGEIEILRLVGATEGYVRFPFVLEALLQGLGGAVVSLILLWILYQTFRFSLEGSWNMFAGWIRFRFLSPGAMLGLMVLGTVVGILSCIVSFSRFSTES